MQLTMENTGDANRIERYAAGAIVINGVIHTATLALAPSWLRSPWGPAQPADLEPNHLRELLDRRPELILIGTGASQRFPPRTLLREAITAGVGIEVMTTAAACRTYAVLSAERRDVLAVLFMIQSD
jgi:uncharacterized protein